MELIDKIDINRMADVLCDNFTTPEEQNRLLALFEDIHNSLILKGIALDKKIATLNKNK